MRAVDWRLIHAPHGYVNLVWQVPFTQWEGNPQPELMIFAVITRMQFELKRTYPKFEEGKAFTVISPHPKNRPQGITIEIRYPLAEGEIEKLGMTKET